MATRKQKAAAIKIVENHGNVSKTMLDVGYTEASAKNPSNLTESKGWKELMNEYLPDSLLMQRHRELLDKKEPMVVSKGLDMAYKVKGAYAPEKHINVNTSIESESPEALKQLAHGLLNSQRQ